MKLIDAHIRDGIERAVYAHNGNVVVRTSQDVQPLLDACEKMRNAPEAVSRRKSDFWHVAEIPPIAIYEANKKYGCDVMAKDNRKLLRKLINSEWKNFKTKEVTL